MRSFIRTPVGSAKVSGVARTKVNRGQKPRIVGELNFDAELGSVHGGPIGFIGSAAAWLGAAFSAKGKIEADFDGEEIHVKTSAKPKVRLGRRSHSLQ